MNSLRLVVALGLVGTLGCARGAVRRLDAPRRDYPAGVVDLVWHRAIREKTLVGKRPGECATAAVAGDRLVVGSRSGAVVGLDLRDGRQLWRLPVSGAVDAEARYDAALGQVYVGNDEGLLMAIDPEQGKLRWTFTAKGAVERAPALGGGSLFLTTAEDRIYALDPAKGRLLWQYEREATASDDFTIHGHAGARVAGDRVFAGFSDGFLVALRASGGDVIWARSLAAASEQYVDVDSTPSVVGSTVVASSYSGGLYGLDSASGEIKWRLGVEGAGTARPVADRLYFAAPRDGIGAISASGHFLWRQGLAEAGELTPPVAAGPFLLFTGTRAGLFVVDRVTGQLLETWNPGQGICGGVALDPSGEMAFVLANSGEIFALRILPPPT